jgi:hypothetical protein
MSNTNFQSLQKQLQKSRETLQTSREALFLTSEKLRRIESQQAQLKRYYDADNESHRTTKEELSAKYKQTTAEIASVQHGIGALEERLNGILGEFLVLTDPRERIEELSDTFPILMLPLRLETRFKQVATAEGTQHQLWVRVFPDDCAIDTFEAPLSETEVKNAQMYWAQVWRAGEDVSMLRAAWRNLVASHGVGRALWIERNYRPINEADQPTPDATTRLLVIPSDRPLDDATQTHVNNYWSAYWRAYGDANKITAAYDALVNNVGPEMSETIIDEFRPINLNDTPPVGVTYETATVLVTVAKFPSAEDTGTKRRAWSKAPHVDVMPERLVLMGYNGETLTLQEISAPIPSTLITGPNPLAEEGDQIRQEGADIKVSQDMLWIVDFEEALQKGMAFRVILTPQQYNLGFDKLMVWVYASVRMKLPGSN